MYSIEDFRRLNKSENIVISLHGQLRLNERNIAVDDIMNAIDNGEIIDCGTHEELLKNSKTYQEIYHSQNQEASNE